MPFIARRLVHETGLPLDQIKIVLSQVYGILLCFGLVRIKDPATRKYYSLIFGTLLQIYVYGEYFYQYLFQLVEMVVVYWICKNFTKSCGKIVTIGSVLVLSIFHIYRMIIDYGGWQMDITTLMMVMVIKFSLFAFQCQDGTKTGHKLEELTPEQREARIVEIPSLYNFLCYLQLLPSSVMGPSIDYKAYSDFINLEKQYAHIPDTHKPMFKSLMDCIGCLFVYQVLYQMFFPVSFMATKEYLNLSWLRMTLYSFFSLTFIRFKYYLAWKLNSCTVHACGLSYEKTITNEDGKKEHVFEKHPHVHVMVVETTEHVKLKISNWNIPAQNWLRRCVYERVKGNGQFITFMVSAFWHGFYGGYYLSFIMFFSQVFLAQLVYRVNQNYPVVGQTFAKTGIVGKASLWIVVNLIFNLHASYFQLLSFRSGWNIIKAFNFMSVLIVLVPAIILQFSGLARKKRSKEHKKDTRVNGKQAAKGEAITEAKSG